MNLSFDINTHEGDKVVVSLSSSYPYLKDIFPTQSKEFELVEVSIIREWEEISLLISIGIIFLNFCFNGIAKKRRNIGPI